MYDNDLLKRSDDVLLYGDKAFSQIEDTCSLIFLTPGIAVKDIPQINYKKITNQCDIFLRLFAEQSVGISGTKGKSTVSTLIYEIIKRQYPDTILAGNIGIPFFDIMSEIQKDSIIVLELSCHQLQHIKKAPKVSVLLNLYEEHLDHYNSFEEYQLSKINLLTKGKENFTFIYNEDDIRIVSWVKRFNLKRYYKPFSLKQYTYSEPKYLQGNHNKLNILAAISASQTLGFDDYKAIQTAIEFKGLNHRLQFVKQIDDVKYYNDSISTIPQATLAALDSLKDVSVLILGGMDRGIDYSIITQVVSKYNVKNIAFVGKAGKRMYDIISQKYKVNAFISNDWHAIVEFCKANAKPHSSVLLSPAASSYDQFKNFEYRGHFFEELLN